MKITGKNIVGRSNHIAVLFENIMYVHGGYSPEYGILSDFYCMDIGRDSPDFEWKQLNTQVKLNSGSSPRADSDKLT